MKTAIFLFTLSAMYSNFCLGVDMPASGEDIRSWLEITPLQPLSDEMLCANRSAAGEWSVSILDGKIHIQSYTAPQEGTLPFIIPKRPRFLGSRSVLKTDDGFLVGFDAGEWGGSLWWFSKNGADSYMLSADNIIKLIDIDGIPIAIMGLAHLSIDYGGILELARHSTKLGRKWLLDLGADSDNTPTKNVREIKWGIERSLSLDSRPYTFARDNKGGLLIITTKGLSYYYKGAIQHIHSSYYGSVYPNSIAISSEGIIFVGMRHAIAKLTPNSGGYTESWLVPPSCAVLEVDKCKCKPASANGEQ